MKEEKLEGFFCKAANGHLCYEIYQATADFIFVAANILKENFGFSEPKRPIVGLDEVLTEVTKDGFRLMLGWNTWSGFYVMSDSSEADIIVDEFGNYLGSIIQQPEFEIYIHIW